jgi:hypothetical protein
MRVLVLAILMIAAVSANSSARAQTYNPRYPVCLKVIEMFGGERYECLYNSLEQCTQSAFGLAATCVVNPFYGYSRSGPRYR